MCLGRGEGGVQRRRDLEWKAAVATPEFDGGVGGATTWEEAIDDLPKAPEDPDMVSAIFNRLRTSSSPLNFVPTTFFMTHFIPEQIKSLNKSFWSSSCLGS
ncbi:hypothetical protein L484_019399 [Morus notabilis]|uniref:Uncharacterized protein n=1 Tax=Morus notabilis TaxID=981085 RepID=W9RQS7_9ROSA|nr:hypothetical protein L484_019399 [Morus notabilis]